MPLVGSSKPAIIRSVVVLPEPEGPSMVKNSPARDLQVDPGDRDNLTVALGEAGQADIGRRSSYVRHVIRAGGESKDKATKAGWP